MNDCDAAVWSSLISTTTFGRCGAGAPVAGDAPVPASATNAATNPTPTLAMRSAPIEAGNPPPFGKSRLGGAAVEAVDDVRVLLGDDVALDLHGRGQLAALLREVGREDRDLLDLLDA